VLITEENKLSTDPGEYGDKMTTTLASYINK